MTTLRLEMPIEKVSDPSDERIRRCADEDLSRFEALGLDVSLGKLLSYDPAHSTLAVYLVGLDAQVELPDGKRSLGACLLDSQINLGTAPGRLVVPPQARGFVGAAGVDADRPAIIVALARWPSGRTRIVLGGFGSSPTLAMDGTEAAGAEEAVRNALSGASDEWASAEWRLSHAKVLLNRGLVEIEM